MGKRVEAAMLATGLALFAGGAHTTLEASERSPEATAAVVRFDEISPDLVALAPSGGEEFDILYGEAREQLATIDEDLDQRGRQLRLGAAAMVAGAAPMTYGLTMMGSRALDALLGAQAARHQRKEESSAAHG